MRRPRDSNLAKRSHPPWVRLCLTMEPRWTSQTKMRWVMLNAWLTIDVDAMSFGRSVRHSLSYGEVTIGGA
ncbi:MAG: hypothetical protein Fues2KO_27220 [Fuerstiella sp.]